MGTEFNVADKLMLTKTYKEHRVFVELDEMMKFYDCVSDRAFYFIPSGTKCIANYESYYFMSIQGTLDSVKNLLKIARINDAFVLIRKIFDDILTEIYLDITLKDKFDINKGLYVEEVQKWIDSSFRIPSVKKILKAIKKSPQTKGLYPFFGWDTYLEHNRKLLDDCVHANKYSSVLLNCNTVCLDGRREKQLDNISIMLNQLMMIQVSFIFYLNPAYMMASDYMDYLEVGENPPNGSDQWVAPFAQNAFDSYVKRHPKLAEFIKSTCCLDID